MSRIDSLVRRLRRDRSGLAMVEFALTLPLLLTAGLGGSEMANYVITNLQVGQLAVHVADNASRIGDTSTLTDRKIYESDINDLLRGANFQAGDSLDIFQHGRVIISSLETEPDAPENQYIHWQRCMGIKNVTSSYGVAGDGLGGGLDGMGPPDEEVIALEGDAVIFVEIVYDYQPLIPGDWIDDMTIRTTSSFTVRDDRDLGDDGIFQRDPGSPDPVASCGTFSDVIG